MKILSLLKKSRGSVKTDDAGQNVLTASETADTKAENKNGAKNANSALSPEKTPEDLSGKETRDAVPLTDGTLDRKMKFKREKARKARPKDKNKDKKSAFPDNYAGAKASDGKQKSEAQVNPQKTARQNEKSGKKRKKKKEHVPVYFRMSLTDCVTLEINGFNQTRLLKELTDGGVKIAGIRRFGSGRMHIRIRKKQREKTFAICESMCYTYSVVSRDGFFAFFSGNLRRAGIVVGTVLCAACTFFMSGFVMKIDVNGLENIAKTEFLTYLSESGLEVGSRISALDREEIRKVVNDFEGIAESGVEIKGTTVVINVVEREETFPRVELKPQLISRYDARVTRIICSSGTAKVKTGQIVKKGDTLIEGAVYDQNGESLDFPGALGVVYGQVVYSQTFTVTADAYVYRRTGNKKTVTTFSVAGLKAGKNKSPYASYESVTTVRTLSGFLPVKVEQTVYYETEAVKEERSVKEITASCVDEALMQFTGPDENLYYKTHVEELCPGTYNVSVYIEAETIISD